MTDEQFEIFFQVYGGLPRQGPGLLESTRRAFDMLPDLGPAPRILDVGCGSGTQTFDLARMTGGTIVAVDNLQVLLDELERRIEEKNLAEQVTTLCADMNALPFDPKSFDLIWSEGAIYQMGFENGFRSLRGLLAEGGCLAMTEATWLRPDPPEDLREKWEQDYPAMTGIEANLKTIRQCGFEVLGHFTLPESAWWDPYYTPMEKRLPGFEEKFKDDPEALEIVDMAREEIERYRRYSVYYGYEFFVTRRKD